MKTITLTPEARAQAEAARARRQAEVAAAQAAEAEITRLTPKRRHRALHDWLDIEERTSHAD